MAARKPFLDNTQADSGRHRRVDRGAGRAAGARSRSSTWRPTSSPSSSSTRSRPRTSPSWSRCCSCWRATSSSWWSSSGGRSRSPGSGAARHRAARDDADPGGARADRRAASSFATTSISSSTGRWPTSCRRRNDIASDYYRERQRTVSSVAQRLARRLGSVRASGQMPRRRAMIVAPEVAAGADRSGRDLSCRLGRPAAGATGGRSGGAGRPTRVSASGGRSAGQPGGADGRARTPLSSGVPNGGDLVRTAMPHALVCRTGRCAGCSLRAST